MNKLKHLIFVIALSATLFLGTTNAQTTLEYNEIYFEELAAGKNPIPQIAIPQYSTFQMSNGIKVYLMPNANMPIMKFGGFVRGGVGLENAKTSGSYRLISRILSEYEKDFCDVNALDLAFSADIDAFSFEGTSLIDDLDKLVGLTRRTLCRTTLDATIFTRKQREFLQELEDSQSNSEELAEKVLCSYFYGKHPYAYQADFSLQYDNVSRFTVADLNKFYTAAVVPQNTVLWLCGAFDPKQAEQLLRREFATWQSQSSKKINLKLKPAKQQSKSRGKVLLIDKEDAAQATIILATDLFNIEYGNNHMSEKIAFDLAGEIYGSGDFDSLLMKELRVKRDFVYGVSAWMSSKQAGGNFRVQTTVIQEHAAETVDIIRNLISDLQQGKIHFAQTDLERIVNQRNAVYPGVFKHSQDVMNGIISNVELRQRSENYFNEFIAAYNQTTVEQAETAFKEFIDVDDALIVVVGRIEKLLPQFQNKNVKVYSFD